MPDIGLPDLSLGEFVVGVNRLFGILLGLCEKGMGEKSGEATEISGDPGRGESVTIMVGGIGDTKLPKVFLRLAIEVRISVPMFGCR